ncbi:SDR family NAD(P)-dependent oxidoreductase [Arthrobacter sulfonylureivorans]|uniref:SDR family NAD(P)-dependent oxidoreductase n=1 Tax=Arthrobacter sulfonylureivorans TaxID=2486855 RepID=UPI0039E30C40
MSNSPLTGRTALVSGAGRGIGAAHAAALVQNGAKVVLGDVDAKAGEATALELGAAARFIRLDVTNPDDWSAAVTMAEDPKWGSGHVDILVNNAGVSIPRLLEDMTVEEWQKTLDVNLTGHFNGISAVISSMKQAGGGAIVNTSSMTATVPVTKLAHYVATKMAIDGLTKVAALELGRYGIRVNSLHPGYIDTAMMGGAREDAVAGNLPIPRFGRPEEVADMMIYIVSRAVYSTGSQFAVDGGVVSGIEHG